MAWHLPGLHTLPASFVALHDGGDAICIEVIDAPLPLMEALIIEEQHGDAFRILMLFHGPWRITTPLWSFGAAHVGDAADGTQRKSKIFLGK